MVNLQDIINRNRAWYCLECGKCSAVCPITVWETRAYCSPRLLIEKALNGNSADVYQDPLFWSCLTCQRCSELCPSNVLFSDFVRDARGLARNAGLSGDCSHGDVIQTWGQMMTDPDLDQNRLEWLDRDLKISDDSETLYFVGCLPYYAKQFENLGIEGLEIARAAVRILNHLGIEPQILSDERCCGHDQIWEGDLPTFDTLARLNLERIRATEAKQIITTCPECARTLGLDYPKRIGEHGMEVLHLSQFISRRTAAFKSEGRSKISDGTATYQDACRLSRHLGVYEEPRALLRASGLELVEMERTHRSSLCCGTSGWTSCGKVSKNIQVERLREAKATGAELLVTSCIKCQIHFKCAQQDPALKNDIAIPIRDLATVLADRL
ncbi:MAG: (Fe-S)-binding protein [Deltaproteobacteria bacterium]|jgi:Fe-S oxidoreductase|nr:(Fe-S)-binding protein [Deltaproteobacteria bacterium]